ncbi:aminotransferase class V-fold PLP-dependent enzyme, partial [Aduncisulcus paluster]
EALMVEPTETESMETLEDFGKVMKQIAHEAVNEPELLKNAPHRTPVRRIDEVRAARDLILKYKDSLKASE